MSLGTTGQVADNLVRPEENLQALAQYAHGQDSNMSSRNWSRVREANEARKSCDNSYRRINT